jgi:hypothetical protein
MGWMTKELGLDFRQEQDISDFTASKTALRPTQPLAQWVKRKVPVLN